MMVFRDDFDENWKGLIYDLRQIYAVSIIGETLKQVAFARKSGNFPLWFKLLKRDLKIEISKGLEDEEIKEVDKEIEKIKHVISKNSNVYTGKSKEEEGYEKIEESLINFEILLLKLMEEHKMFGSKKTVGRI